MSIFDRLFGKRSQEPPARPAPPRDAFPHAPERAAEGDPGVDEPSAIHDANRDEPGTEPAPSRGKAPPLRSLTRYQHDPAYNSFKQRFTRAPGTERLRSRNLDYPRRDEPKR